MDWTQSGIRNSFRYVLLGPWGLEDVRGDITAAVKGGKITEGWRSDYRSSCELELDGDGLSATVMQAQDYAIRVIHTATFPDGSQSTRELGTFMPDGLSRDIGRGGWDGTLTLYSEMLRLGTDLRAGDRWIPAGTGFSTHFASLVAGAGGVPSVHPAISGSFGSGHVWEAGKSVLSECHAIADACGGYVGVDGHGRITLTPYIAPSARPCAWRLRDNAGDHATDRLGEQMAGIVNKVVCHHESGDLIGDGSCTLDAYKPWHPWCRSRLGRWAVEDYQLEAVPDWIATNAQLCSWLQAKAEQRMQELAGNGTKWTCKALYDPAMAPGSAGKLEVHTTSEGILHDCCISEREIELTPAMKCSLTIEEV